MKGQHRIVIISGGAESVSLAVAESLWSQGLPYVVISIVRDSILEGLPGCARFCSIWSSNLDRAAAIKRLGICLQTIHDHSGEDLVLFPTEDDSLYLLNACKTDIEAFTRFSGARRLKLGGLDKAELFAFLQESNLGELIVPTMEVQSPERAHEAMAEFGVDTIFKPAYKPWSRSIGQSGLKVISRRDLRDSPEQVVGRLEDAWHLCDRWVAQKRMPIHEGAERSACIVRSDRVAGCEVSEIYKYPRIGGSAVLVQSVETRTLMPLATRIADEIDLIGMCEMTFLPDEEGRPRMLELNTRPWLQLELVEKSGYPIVGETIRALDNQPLQADKAKIVPREWVHAERFVLGWISGEMAPRWQSLRRLLQCFRVGGVVSVYSNKLPKARRRWIMKNLKRPFTRFRRWQESKSSF